MADPREIRLKGQWKICKSVGKAIKNSAVTFFGTSANGHFECTKIYIMVAKSRDWKNDH